LQFGDQPSRSRRAVAGAEMILVVTTKGHRYTHDKLAQADEGFDLRVITYEDVFAAKAFESATYILTDFDRLSPTSLHLAGTLYRNLHKAGNRVLNNPARQFSRQGLLRRLSLAGINVFNAYRFEESEQPARWPVFLRVDGNHTDPVSGLLDDWTQVEAAAKRAIEAGCPLSKLLVIEYAAEPVRPGLFRKLSVFRVGDAMVGYTCVHDDQWLVKHGKAGITPPDLYREEYEIVRDNPYGEALRAVFDLAAVDYGRADFGLVGGRPQIYEINTNPDVKLGPTGKTPPDRLESAKLLRANFMAAMRALDTVQETAP
jgi:hypothetical protein